MTTPVPALRPWLLSGPALLLFIGLLLVPLLLTLMLSFRGIQRHGRRNRRATRSSNYWEVVSDPYYGTIFLRTAGARIRASRCCPSCSACPRPSCSRE